jgi:hypothetical protein
MPRDVSGNYSLPLPPVQPDTVIETDWANPTLDDVANGITNSLSRDGQGAMRSQLQLADGSVGSPGLAFSSGTSSGLWRTGTAVGFSYSGVQYWSTQSGRFQVEKPASFIGQVTIGATTPASSYSALGLESKTKLLQLNRVTTAEKTVVPDADAQGMFVFDTDLGVPSYNNGSAWFPVAVGGGGDALPLTGGTLTGDLAIEKSAPGLYLQETSAGEAGGVFFQRNGLSRWRLNGMHNAATGSDVGHDFAVVRYSDGGGPLGDALTIKRSTGDATFSGRVNTTYVKSSGLLSLDGTTSISFKINEVAYAALSTSDFRPNVSGASTLGTSTYRWGESYIDTVHGDLVGNVSSASSYVVIDGATGVQLRYAGAAKLGLTASTVSPLTDNAIDMGSSGVRWRAGYFITMYGAVVGNVTGNVTGTASGNLALTGGTVTGAATFNNTTMVVGGASTADSLFVKNNSAPAALNRIRFYVSSGGGCYFAGVDSGGTATRYFVMNANGTAAYVGGSFTAPTLIGDLNKPQVLKAINNNAPPTITGVSPNAVMTQLLDVLAAAGLIINGTT